MVQCTETWSGEGDVVNEVYTKPQCFIESEDMNNTRGRCCSSKSYYLADKLFVFILSEKYPTDLDHNAVCQLIIKEE